MKTVVIDYGMGNLRSVSKALEVVGADVLVSNDPGDIEQAGYIVLPGVGSFAQGMQHLIELDMVDRLTDEVVNKKKPFLGICLGMQLAARTGEEGGQNKGLGWINAKVTKMNLKGKKLKIPHMGWDDVEFIKETPLFSGLKSPTTLYFVHSYHFVPADREIDRGLRLR